VRTQYVDTPAAREFLEQVLAVTTRDELEQIATEVEAKSAAMRTIVGADPALMDAAAVRDLLGWVFCARRHVSKLLALVDAGDFAAGLAELLYGTGGIAQRYEAFADLISDCPEMAADLPGELLHFLSPERYWMWTRWMWDPDTDTGSLRLVTMDEVDLFGDSRGQMYLTVGQALAFVEETGRAAGFARIGNPPFGTDVFLAAVYSIYMQTVLRMRLTQEFTNLLPPLPALTRRLLGVHRPREN
jgi:hypothetical protein